MSDKKVKVAPVVEEGEHVKALARRAEASGDSPVDTAVVLVRVYDAPEGMPTHPAYEVCWEAVNKDGITLYDSGSERDGYEPDEENQMIEDIKARYGNKVPIQDVRPKVGPAVG